MANSVAKNTLYSSLNIYVEYFIGFIISILIARTLGPDDYGNYSYFIKLAGIAIIFTNAGIGTGAIKFIAEARASESPESIAAIYAFFAKMQRIKTAVVCTVMSALLFLRPEWFLGPGSEWLLSLLVAAVIVKSAHMFRVGVFKGFERFDLLAFSVLIVAPANLLIVAVAYTLEWTLWPFLTTYAGISLLYWIISSYFLRQVPRIAEPVQPLSDELKKRMKHHLKVASLNAILSGLAIGQCEVLLLKQMVGNESVAFFTIAMTISGAAMLLVPGVYSSVLFPVIARAVADVRQDATRRINESARYLFTLGMMVAAPTFLYGEQIVGILYGEEFSKAGWVLSIFVMFAALRVFTEPFSAYLMSSDRQTVLLRLSVFSLFVAWTANYLLIERFALEGAVYARMGIVALMIGIYLFMWKGLLSALPELGKFLRVLLVAVLAGWVTMASAGIFTGILAVLFGYLLFGVVYLLLLVLLNGLGDDDYKLLVNHSGRLGTVPSKVMALIVSMRLKI